MRISRQIERIGDRYHVTTGIIGLSTNEDQLVMEHGEQIVDVGGSFSGSATRPGEGATSVTFTFPSKELLMPSQFPDVRIFDLADDADSDVMAKVYSDTIVTRLTSAITTLRSLSSPFVIDDITTV